MKKIHYVIYAVIIGLIHTGCKNSGAGNNDQDLPKVCVSDSMQNLIRIDTVHANGVNDEVTLAGEVSFDDSKVVKVFPFSSGQVQKVFVSQGDKIQKGQTLAIIRSADVSGNYNDLVSADNDISIAKKEYDNMASLYKNGIASEKDYLEAKENYNKALNAASKIKTQIAINGGGHTSASGEYIVKAPISGYLVEKNTEGGSFIRSDNGQNIFTIGDIDQVWIWANVYETDVAKVREGYAVEITTIAYPGKIFTGTIDKVNQQLDPQSKVMKVRITVANPGHELKPEMFANVVVKNKEEKELVSIPRSAIITENGKDFVVQYHDKCNLEIREVNPLKTIGDNTYITGGLQEGDRIITQQQILYFRQLLNDF
jgi:membrane fusion protein, heavy metal efflux system